MKRGDLVKILAESIEKYNALPKEEKRLMQVQNDTDVFGYVYRIFRGNRLAVAQERGERIYFG